MKNITYKVYMNKNEKAVYSGDVTAPSWEAAKDFLISQGTSEQDFILVKKDEQDANSKKASAHEQALSQFMATVSKINTQIEELKDYFDDHMGFDPESINWGHVGDAGYFLEQLTELTNRAYHRSEDTE